MALSQHLFQAAFIHLQPFSFEHIALQCRSLVFANGWKLRTIANQQQTAMIALVDIGDEVG